MSIIKQVYSVGAKRQMSLLTIPAALMMFSKENRLADQMEQGKLHYHDANATFNNENAVSKPYFERGEPEYSGHVPLTTLERLGMILGSLIGSYFHPERNEFIVGLGESTAFPFILRELRRQMLSDATGRRILRERPRMTLTSLDLEYLRSLPESTLGRTYVEWLDKEGVSPDTRVAVRYIDNEELAYVFQRYRECHDFYHAITGLPIIIEGEISVKVLEFFNIGIPMTGLGAAFAPLRLKPQQKQRLYSIYYPWAIRNGLRSKPLINVFWEELLERDVNELRSELGIEAPPDLRELRRQQRKKLGSKAKTAKEKK